ncbi:MAG: DNA gyrase inhibitor YacG [Hasllibacter sp.]
MACPICRKEPAARYRPFCSKRCADVDLGRWMTGGYAVPSRDPDDLEKAAEALGRGEDGTPPTRH